MNHLVQLHLDAIDEAKGLCFADLNEKQTAVEWLAEKYNYVTWLRNRDEISAGKADEWRAEYLEQAKKMEKEQLNIARLDGIQLANKDMENKQTAVEWLRDQYMNCPENFLLSEDFQKALEMEKQQIIKAVSAGHDYCEDGKVRWMGEQYYNETYDCIRLANRKNV